mgnify:CR=1 FL=1
MPIAFVQSTIQAPGTVSSGSLAFASANTQGGLLLACFRTGTTDEVNPSITDTLGNTYSSIFNVPSSLVGRSYGFYAKDISSGPNTVSFVHTSAVLTRWAIHEYSGIDTVSPLDQVGSTIGKSTTPASPTVGITTGNELLFGWGAAERNPVWTAGTSYNLRVASSTLKIFSEDIVVSSTGTYRANAFLSSSGGWTMTIVTFFGTAAGAGSVVKPRLLGLLGVGA